MKTKVTQGDTIPFAHTAAVTSGQALPIGDLLGVACGDGAANQEIEYAIAEVHHVTKLGTDVVAAGAQLYWDAGNSRLTTTAGIHKKAGRAWRAAGNGATTVAILLNSNG